MKSNIKYKDLKKKIQLRISNSIVARYYKEPLVENMMMFTSRNGADIAGNMLRLMIEAYNSETNYTIGVAATPEKKNHIKEVLANYGLHDVKIIRYDTNSYYKWLERSKYIFCDATLSRRFIKREGQVYVNTWHGTPLKKMGNDSKSDRHNVANVQKNLLITDIFVCPSEYYLEKMHGAYDIQDIYQGELAFHGYPRNSIFYDKANRENVRKKYNIEDKKVYVYMPTYRESKGVKYNDMQVSMTVQMIDELSQKMGSDEVLYVKLHVFNVAELDLSKYTNVKSFPSDIETYEFLNASDVLISDYSSVMYDYANSRNLIVRYVYDEEAYLESRGMYEQPVEMPFPKVYEYDKLLDTIRAGKQYDDSEFIETYCKYDNANATKKVFNQAVTMKPVKSEEISNKGFCYYYNEKIRDNIISDNLKDIIDETKSNSFMAFSKQSMRRNPKNYKNIPPNVKGVLGYNNVYYKTLGETFAFMLLYKFDKCNSWIEKKLDELYEREYIRQFSGYPIKESVFYQGYSTGAAEILSRNKKKSTIYVYYNWLNRYRKVALKHILKHYKEIVACDEEMIDVIKDILGADFDIKKVRVNTHYL